MKKNKRNKWWRYLIVSFIGIFSFSIFIPSCTYLSSANFDVLVRDKKPEAIADETKSFADIVANLPTPEQIQAMPLAAHPRLLASEARFAEIKRQIRTDETARKWYRKIHRYAEAMLQEQLPVYKKDDKRLISRIHSKAMTLAFVYRIEKDRRYLDRVWQELNTVAQFANWNPGHFLNTAMITYAFAISYDWLYDDWNVEQRNIISSAIVEKGLKPAMNAYKSEDMWVKAEHNWNQVCNGGIGIGALAVFERYPDLASAVLHQSLQGLPYAMRNYAPDGGWDEGLKYWNFGTFYNTLFVAALNTTFDRDFGLSAIYGYRETGLFPIYMTGSTRIPFNFADGNNEPMSSPALFWMSERFNKPVYSYFQKRSPVHGVMDLVWYKSTKKEKTLQQLPLDNYFRGTEVVSIRSEWENPESIFVGFKAGDNSATHSNLDLGTFVIDALGVRWATELGRDNYSLPGYFDSKEQRWTYYKTRAEGQNTLVIDPTERPDQNPQAKSKIIRFVSQPEKGYAIADLTQAYYPKASKVLRGISLQNRRKQVLVQDEIRADTPINLLWFMHTIANISISEDGKTAMLDRDGKRLWAKLLNPEPNYKFTVMDAKPLATSPHPKGQVKNLNIRKLTIKLEGIENEDLAVLFVPLDKKQKPPRNVQEIKELSQW